MLKLNSSITYFSTKTKNKYVSNNLGDIVIDDDFVVIYLFLLLVKKGSKESVRDRYILFHRFNN